MSDDLLASRRARIAAALPLDTALLLVGAGDPVPLPEASDQAYPFRSHADYFYLAGRECAGGVIGFDPAEVGDHGGSGWVSFVPTITESERVWEGRAQLPGTPLDQLPRWLEQRRGRRIALLGATPRSVSCRPDPKLTTAVRDAFMHARRVKDCAEIALLRRAAAATAHGFLSIPELLRPGTSERTLQIELEAAFFRAGGSRTGYSTIVGGGPNGAVLHFEPTARPLREGEFVLIDAGAEIDRYVADVTRTFVVGGRPTAFQRDLYQLVLSTEEHVIERCVPGAEWKELHLGAAVELVAGLVAMGVMRGRPEALVEQEAHTLFYPHGLGHMVGLGVRDASGLLPGRIKDPRPSLRTLRMDLPLAVDYVVTVEPGLYFIPELLNDPTRRERYRDVVNWERVDQQLGIGGVRIEDNVRITDGVPEVLTAAIPK